MKILIVGGLGYLGPVIASRIKETVSNASLDTAETAWFVKSRLVDEESYYGKILKKDKRDLTIEDLQPYDVVIDLAAVSNDPMGKDFEDPTMEINGHAAISLAERCKTAGVKRFVFASSCSIYGSAGDQARFEGDSKGPLTAYAKSKWLVEQGIEPLAKDDFSIIALRFATACGWSPHFRADLVLNDFVLTALVEQKITVLSDGTPWRPLIHVRDIGLAVAWACQVHKMGFEAYNVGSNNWTLTIGELANIVSEIMNVEVDITNDNGPDKRSYRVAFDKFEADANGWTPQENVQTSVDEMAKNLRPFVNELSDFRNGKLIRLNVLRQMVENEQLDKSLRRTGEF